MLKSLLCASLGFLFSLQSLQADPFDNLPDETTLHVISFLGPKDVLNLGETSKRNHAITEDEQVWRGLYFENIQVQEYTKNDAVTETQEIIYKDLFVQYYKALKDFRALQEKSLFVVESQLVGYNVHITYELLIPSNGVIWNFVRTETLPQYFIQLSKCAHDPSYENLYLLTADVFSTQRTPRIINICAYSQSGDKNALFTRNDSAALFPILPHHKIVLNQVAADQDETSKVAGLGLNWLKLSVHPLSKGAS